MVVVAGRKLYKLNGGGCVFHLKYFLIDENKLLKLKLNNNFKM